MLVDTPPSDLNETPFPSQVLRNESSTRYEKGEPIAVRIAWWPVKMV